jgi:hypothetical protein
MAVEVTVAGCVAVLLVGLLLEWGLLLCKWFVPTIDRKF